MTMSIGRNQVRQVVEAPTLQWANGKNEARLTPGTGRFVSHVGWFTEVGKDDTLDSFLEAAGVAQLEMRHPRPGGQAVIARHWNLGEELRFFPLTAGPVAPTVAASLSPHAHTATVKAGIGVRWGRGESERSKLAVRGYLQIGGRTHGSLVQISVRSRMTDELLAALIDHTRVCEAADGLVDRSKHPEVVQLYELALVLGAGSEAQWGKGETTTVVPLASRHPAAPDLPYLRSIWRVQDLPGWALADWPDVQAWAHEFSFAPEPTEAASYTGGGGR